MLGVECFNIQYGTSFSCTRGQTERTQQPDEVIQSHNQTAALAGGGWWALAGAPNEEALAVLCSPIPSNRRRRRRCRWRFFLQFFQRICITMHFCNSVLRYICDGECVPATCFF